MTTHEIAAKMVELCKQGKNLEAEELFYHPDIVSVEADGTEVKGLAAVKGKTQWFFDNHEVHGGDVPAYYVGHNSFSIVFEVDVTPKGGQRMTMAELGVYTVANGKVVHEQFQTLGA